MVCNRIEESGRQVRYRGDAVVFPEAVQWGGNKDPRGLLRTDATYTIRFVEEHSWHTEVFLEGYEGHFQPQWFETVDPAVLPAGKGEKDA